MIFPAFITVLTLILSFTGAYAIPTTRDAALSGPGSLLGRRYVRHVTTNTPPRGIVGPEDIAQQGPTRRADRFQAIQRRIARNPAAERLVYRAEHDENLLSNQTLTPPTTNSPTISTPAPAAAAPPPPDATGERVIGHPRGGKKQKKAKAKKSKA